MNNVREIIWDFDGVILLSDSVREYGFRKIFENHHPDEVEKLIHFHRLNGGLSRYVKIRFFYENILHQKISDEAVIGLAESFSLIMKEALTDKALLNPQWLAVMKKIGSKYTHSIASGSDGKELRYLCGQLQVAHHFKFIEGSPTPKNDLVHQIIQKSSFATNQFVLVGDAVNDWEAAKVNGIEFIGYSNQSLKKAPYFVDDLAMLTEILK